MRIPALIAAAMLLALPAAAQPEPPRPELPRGADPNDWESYYSYGEQNFLQWPTRAYGAFYWASRLDPTRAEPPLGMWAAFFARDRGMWERYLDDDAQVMGRPQVIENEALLERAYMRNPFVHRGLEVALYVGLGARLRWNRAMEAFVEYGRGDFDAAARRFGLIVRSNPGRNVRFRHYRALSFIGAGQSDSAAVEIQLLLEALRARDETRVGEGYESKARWEYALGRIHEVQGRWDEARAAYERAVVENLAMYPAHAGLARLQTRAGNPEQALVHAATAAEAAPDDAVMHLEHGNALGAAGRTQEAARAYQRAIELEPHWAVPYLRLGALHDDAGQAADAVAAYRAFVERAPRRHASAVQTIQQRIAALSLGS